RALQFLRGRNPMIAIIVPIYNAVADVEACLQALANNTKTDCRLLLIDDASTDPLIAPLLDNFQKTHRRVEVIRNKTNQGFTKTVAQGISLAGTADVVLL